MFRVRVRARARNRARARARARARIDGLRLGLDGLTSPRVRWPAAAPALYKVHRVCDHAV